MADEASSTTPKPKEAEVLTDASLVLLARFIGQERLNGLVLPMMLNLPTTTIVRSILEVNEAGLQVATDVERNNVFEKCILLWKRNTAELKTKERVKALERALREMGKNEIADILMEKHHNKEEITSDTFNSVASAMPETEAAPDAEPAQEEADANWAGDSPSMPAVDGEN